MPFDPAKWLDWEIDDRTSSELSGIQGAVLKLGAMLRASNVAWMDSPLSSLAR